jgi:AraC family transcriptional regulator
VTNGELKVEIFGGASFSDPVPQILTEQNVAKVLKPGAIEVGLRPGELSKYCYAPGEMVVCRRHIEEWVRRDSSVEMLIIRLPDQALRTVAEETGGGAELNGTPRLNDERIRALMTAVEVEWQEGFLSGSLYLDAIGQALAAVLVQACGILRKPLRRYRGGLAPAQLRRVTEFVQEHLEHDLSLHQMAETASLSTAYFSQVFRQSTGVTPHQFVLRARVERAKSMLRDREARVLDVALACGFQTQQHFARVFRALCKASPSEYRRDGL